MLKLVRLHLPGSIRQANRGTDGRDLRKEVSEEADEELAKGLCIHVCCRYKHIPIIIQHLDMIDDTHPPTSHEKEKTGKANKLL